MPGATLYSGACSSEEERRPSKPRVGGSNPSRRIPLFRAESGEKIPANAALLERSVYLRSVPMHLDRSMCGQSDDHDDRENEEREGEEDESVPMFE